MLCRISVHAIPFLNNLIEIRNPWAGAGTCGIMELLESLGKDVYGVEVSDVRTTMCARMHQKGLVYQAPLHDIPYGDNMFDLVISSEVAPTTTTLIESKGIYLILHLLSWTGARACADCTGGKIN